MREASRTAVRPIPCISSMLHAEKYFPNLVNPKLNLAYDCHFPIDLAPIEILIGAKMRIPSFDSERNQPIGILIAAKSIGKWQLQFRKDFQTRLIKRLIA